MIQAVMDIDLARRLKNLALVVTLGVNSSKAPADMAIHCKGGGPVVYLIGSGPACSMGSQSHTTGTGLEPTRLPIAHAWCPP